MTVTQTRVTASTLVTAYHVGSTTTQGACAEQSAPSLMPQMKEASETNCTLLTSSTRPYELTTPCERTQGQERVHVLPPLLVQIRCPPMCILAFDGVPPQEGVVDNRGEEGQDQSGDGHSGGEEAGAEGTGMADEAIGEGEAGERKGEREEEGRG